MTEVQTQSPVKQRLEYLEVLRVICMFLVVTLHCITAYLVNVSYYGTRSWWLFLVISGFCRMSVPTFFMISGYLALKGKSAENIGSFYRKKLKTMIPFLFWDVVYFLVNCIEGDITPTLGLFLSELVVQGSEFHLWFMYRIMAFYLLTPFLKKITDHCSHRQLWLLVGLVILPSVFYVINVFFPVYLAPMEYLMDGYLGFYLLGYVVGTMEPDRKQRIVFYAAGVAGLILVVWGNAHFCSPEKIEFKFNYGCALNRYLMAAGFFVLVRQIMTGKGLLVKALTRIAKVLAPCSYGVYLMHVLVRDWFMVFMDGWNVELTPLMDAGILTVAVSVICILVCLVFKRVKFLKQLI